MSDFRPLIDALIDCDEAAVLAQVQRQLGQGHKALDILNDGLIAAMDVVGSRMESEEMFIPEVLMAAKIMGKAVEILKPMLSDGDISARGQVVIGTVKGDLHDIGKNLVAMMLESCGMEVHNIGIDIAPAVFVEKVQSLQADILCLSALLSTTMPMMQETIKAVTESGIRNQVKILVGGAPVTQRFADEIGADGYAPDAGSAARLAKTMLSK